MANKTKKYRVVIPSIPLEGFETAQVGDEIELTDDQLQYAVNYVREIESGGKKAKAGE